MKEKHENRNEFGQCHTRERKKNRINMRVSDSEMSLLNQLSYEDDESISQIVRKAIKAYFKERTEVSGNG